MPNTFLRKLHKDIGTALTSVNGYTVGSNTQVTIIGLVLANTTTNNITADVVLTATGVDYYLVKDAPIPVGGSAVIVGGDQKVVMQTNDVLKVKSSLATSIDVVMSILEITP